jgi:alanyl-tRNA synthetase
MKSMEKELSAVRSAKALAATSQIANKSQKIQDVNLIIEQLESEIAVDDMRSIAINLREKVKSGVVVLSTISAGKPLLVAAVSSEAIKLGIKAGELIKIGSATLGGGGGGKDDFAQGGGVDPSAIPKAFKEITKLIEGKFN